MNQPKMKMKKSHVNAHSKKQIRNTEAKFILSRCQQKKKRTTGKSIVDPSSNINTDQMDVVPAMAVHFLEEILMNILSRLPVRSLLRFKCVSKSWRTLISDPYFKMKHLSHARTDQHSQKFLVCSRCFDKDDMCSFYCSSLSTAQPVEDVQKLDCPINCRPLRCAMYCCCDGLILLSISEGLDKPLFLLWNPSIRESIVLPHPEFPLEDCIYGLRYDAASDDYKILKIDMTRNSYGLSNEIFTLKNGYWRKTGKSPTGVRFPTCCLPAASMDSLAFVHGKFHWLGFSDVHTVVSFSISNEVYGVMSLRPLLERTPHVFKRFDRVDISVFEGMLCFYSTYNYQGQGECSFKLWVMKEYGVKESWIELFTIRDSGLFTAVPKYRFADGEVLFYCNRLAIRSSAFRTSKGVIVRLCPQVDSYQQGFAYTESLISPKSLISPDLCGFKEDNKMSKKRTLDSIIRESII